MCASWSSRRKTADKLSFEYPEGPITPKQEKLPEPRKNRVKRRASPRKPRQFGPKGTPPTGRGSVPKVPLKV